MQKNQKEINREIVEAEIINQLQKNEYAYANKLAMLLGYKEGITSEFFEVIIAKWGLTMDVVKAIGVYYQSEIKEVSQ